MKVQSIDPECIDEDALNEVRVLQRCQDENVIGLIHHQILTVDEFDLVNAAGLLWRESVVHRNGIL